MQKLALLSLGILMGWFGSSVAANAESRPLNLHLPTDNDGIFSSDPSDFYMYTYRNFEGVSSTPWTAGQYGFVRNQKRTAAGLISTRFHEGVDIRPVRRDSSNKPLDDVRSIADGKVVYVNSVASRSSYGNYVVVEHNWGYGPFYSLYAHLMSTSVRAGQAVTPATVLGRLGYTGNGINVERSHLHLELNLLIEDDFQKWHNKHFTSANHHGKYNGINLIGLDIAGLYLRHKKDPSISIPAFMNGMEVYFKVRVPRSGDLEILRRYPFLANGNVTGNSPSFEIAFSSSGVPLSITPSAYKVGQPTVTWVKYSPTYHSYLTRGRLSGSGSTASLTDSGLRYIQLVTGQF